MSPDDEKQRDHLHCCWCIRDHPQPFQADLNGDYWSGLWYCGACWVEDKLLSLMVPCTEEICD